MKKSTIYYNLCGVAVITGVLIATSLDDFIMSTVTLGLTYAFVRLFDTAGDDWKKVESNHQSN